MIVRIIVNYTKCDYLNAIELSFCVFSGQAIFAAVFGRGPQGIEGKRRVEQQVNTINTARATLKLASRVT